MEYRFEDCRNQSERKNRDFNNQTYKRREQGHKNYKQQNQKQPAEHDFQKFLPIEIFIGIGWGSNIVNNINRIRYNGNHRIFAVIVKCKLNHVEIEKYALFRTIGLS